MSRLTFTIFVTVTLLYQAVPGWSVSAGPGKAKSGRGFSENELRQRILERYGEYVRYFRENNYVALAEFLYPPMYEQLGKTKEEFVQVLKSDSDALDDIHLDSVYAGKPGPIYSHKNYRLSLIRGWITLTYDMETITSSMHTIAISSDEGRTWYFIRPDNAERYRRILEKEIPATILDKLVK